MLHYPTTLAYVEERDDFAVYEDSDGTELFRDIEGDFVDPVECEDCERLSVDHASVHGGDKIVCMKCYDEDYAGCSDCHETYHTDDLTATAHSGESVCDSCRDNYSECYHCDQIWHYDFIMYLERYDRSVCDDDRSAWYSFCDNCDDYCHDDEICCSREDDGGCCEAPAQRFSVRNGDEMLDNDTRVTVSIPAGHLSDEGIGAIARKIRDSQPPFVGERYAVVNEFGQRIFTPEYEEYNNWINLSYRVAEIGAEWQTKEGNYTRRLSKFAYKEFGLKLSPALLSEIGNLGRQHSEGSEVDIEFTRNLNLPRHEFANEDSCWWTDYAESRCALKTNGGMGLRSFGQYGVTGRAWVMPMRRTATGSLRPTFQTDRPDAFIVFNGYGDLSGYAAARIVAGMNGMTYRKIEFSASPMYINSDAGYLVAPESIATAYTDGRLHLDLDRHADLYRTEDAGVLVNV